jgi:hypothetical protein
MSSFREWGTFYQIAGSSAAALTGLQFVVMALITNLDQAPGNSRTIDAFGTPTIVHFGAVLLVSGLLTAPWRTVSFLVFLLAIVGAAGVMYSVLIAWRARRQTEYKPVLEDWMFHVVLPAAAYGVVAAAAYVLRTDAPQALFSVGAAALLLLFIGIHNAWDTVTYIVVERRQDRARNQQ